VLAKRRLLELPTQHIRGILFDLVGTLARFVPEQEALLSRAAAIHGLALPPAVARRALAAAGVWWQHQVAQQPLERRTEAERAELYRGFDAQVLEAAGFEVDSGVTGAIFTTLLELGRESRLEVYADTPPALAGLQAAGYPLGVVSNMDATLEVTLQALDLSGHFMVVVNSQEAGFAKPDPRIFRLAAELMGLPAEALLYVGDQPEIDVVGSLAAGLTPVLVDRDGAFASATEGLRVAALTELPGLLSPGLR
jgi:putative hydrolase of the HAD superfamily